jgi:hypothetical protein
MFDYHYRILERYNRGVASLAILGDELRFPILADTPDIYPAWKTLVYALSVIGKQVHDARLVAVCHVDRITHVLTFNLSHFIRMA